MSIESAPVLRTSGRMTPSGNVPLFEVYKHLYPALRPVHHGMFEMFKK